MTNKLRDISEVVEECKKILSQVESSLKNSNGSKSEITGIIWTAEQEISQLQTNKDLSEKD